MKRRKAILILLASMVSFGIGFLSSLETPGPHPLITTASARTVASLNQVSPQ